MYEFEFYGDLTLPELVMSVFKCMTYAYGSGHTGVRVYINSPSAFDCLTIYSRGWNRRDLYPAIWTSKRGMPKSDFGILFLYSNFVLKVLC